MYWISYMNQTGCLSISVSLFAIFIVTWLPLSVWWLFSLSICLCLSFPLPICFWLPTACLSVCQSATLPACLSVCQSVCLPACLCVCLSVCLSVCLPVCHLDHCQYNDVLWSLGSFTIANIHEKFYFQSIRTILDNRKAFVKLTITSLFPEITLKFRYFFQKTISL